MGDTVYQMVHRAASACSQGKEPGLVYLQFTESYSRPGKSYIESDLRSFRNILGVPKGFPFYFVEILLGPVKEFEAFRQLTKGTKETDEVVRASINNGERLFTFPEYRITTIWNITQTYKFHITRKLPALQGVFTLGPEGLEPSTHGLWVRCSNQLSYRPEKL